MAFLLILDVSTLH